MTHHTPLTEEELREKILNILIKHELNIDWTDEKQRDLVLHRPDLYAQLSLMTSRPSTIELIDILAPFITQYGETEYERGYKRGYNTGRSSVRPIGKGSKTYGAGV